MRLLRLFWIVVLFCVGLAPLFPTARAEEAGANDNEIDDTGGDRSNRSQSCRGRDCKSKRRLEEFGSDSDDGGRVHRRKTTKKGGNNSGGGCCTESGLPDAIADIYGNLILGVSRNPSLKDDIHGLALEGVWTVIASTKPAGEERVRAFQQAVDDSMEQMKYLYEKIEEFKETGETGETWFPPTWIGFFDEIFFDE